MDDNVTVEVIVSTCGAALTLMMSINPYDIDAIKLGASEAARRRALDGIGASASVKH